GRWTQTTPRPSSRSVTCRAAAGCCVMTARRRGCATRPSARTPPAPAAPPAGAWSGGHDDALHGTGRGAVSPRAAACSSARFERKGTTMNDHPITGITRRNEPGALAILEQDPRELRELLSQTLGGGALELQDLDRIKMPTGGALTFEVPTPAGTE